MAVLPLVDGQLRPLLAGLAYTLLRVLANRTGQGLASRIERSLVPSLLRVRRWSGWPTAIQASRLALAIAFPFAMLLGGVYSASDVGLRPVDWASAWPLILATAGGAAAWLSLLWCLHWRARPEATDAPRQGSDPWTSVLTRLLRHCADAATYRAALMPLLGPYWGVWVAVVWKLLASLASGEYRSRLPTPGERERVFLHWALDWVDAVLYALSGSLLGALLGRGAGLVAVLGMARPACRRRGRSRQSRLVQSQGQNPQDGEHGRGQDGDALQVS